MPLTIGVPEIVIVLDAQEAVTPVGKPDALPIPIAPVVVIVILVKAVLIHKVGVVLAAVTELTEITVTTVAVLVPVQPFSSVTCTVYDPAVVAVYVGFVPTIDDPLLQEYVEPLPQEYVEPPLAVKTTLPPEQKVVAPPAVIVECCSLIACQSWLYWLCATYIPSTCSCI